MVTIVGNKNLYNHVRKDYYSFYEKFEKFDYSIFLFFWIIFSIRKIHLVSG